MPGIDQTRQFVPLKIAVLTVSDTRELADDKSGATLAERIEKAGHAVGGARHRHRRRREDPRAGEGPGSPIPAIDVIITTGGTGFTGRDVTPEAVEPLFEKRMDGFSTLFLMVSHAEDRHLDDPDARDRGRRRRDLHLLPAGLARRLPRRLGRNPRAPARLPLPALQLRRDHAAARRASAPAQGQGRDGVSAPAVGRASQSYSAKSQCSLTTSWPQLLRALARRQREAGALVDVRAAVSTLCVHSVIAAVAALAREANAFVGQPRADAEPARRRLDQQQPQPGDLGGILHQHHASRRFRRRSSAIQQRSHCGSKLLTKSATICAHSPSNGSVQPYSCA